MAQRSEIARILHTLIGRLDRFDDLVARFQIHTWGGQTAGIQAVAMQTRLVRKAERRLSIFC